MTFAPTVISSRFEVMIVQKSPERPVYSEHSLTRWRSPLRPIAVPLLASVRRRSTRMAGVYVAGPPRFERGSPGPKPGVLPLDEGPPPRGAAGRWPGGPRAHRLWR